MKKLVLMLLNLGFLSPLFGYSWKVYNDTKEPIRVILKARSRANYDFVLNGGESRTIDTQTWCIYGVYAKGLAGTIKDIEANKEFSLKCASYNVTISPNYHTRRNIIDSFDIRVE